MMLHPYTAWTCGSFTHVLRSKYIATGCQETRQTDHYSWQCHSCWISEQPEGWPEKNCSDGLGWGYDLVFVWNLAVEWCWTMMVSWKSLPGYRMDRTTVHTEPSKRNKSSICIMEHGRLRANGEYHRQNVIHYWLELTSIINSTT